MKRSLPIPWLLVLCLAGCTADTKPITAQPPLRSAKFAYDTRSSNNRIVFHGTAEHAIFEVYSDRGIGTASVTLIEGDWPAAATIRLHTRLLEHLEIETSTGQRAGLEVSSYAHNEQRQVQPDRTAEHPLYLTAKAVDYRTAPDLPRLPIRDPEGYFEIAIPSAMLADAPAWLKLSWIDAYRN